MHHSTPSLGVMPLFGLVMTIVVVCSSVIQVSASRDAKWSGELRNLSYSALSADDVLKLGAEYAQQVAAALGVHTSRVLDQDGRAGFVTLRPAYDSDDLSHVQNQTIYTTTPIVNMTATTTVMVGNTSAMPPSTAQPAGMTTTSTSQGLPPAMPPLSPLRGIAYGALPCKTHSCSDTGFVSEDMPQDAYAKQWGADGRDDLGTMARMGANAVRLYHSLGMGVKHDHGGFLDRAQAEGLNVMPGYHTNADCPNFDCFDTWRDATLQGFKYGFKSGSEWHPAVAALILLNEPDFFGGYPQCKPAGAWCRVKAVLSALDGVLAAEKAAGVKSGRVRLTVTWSFGMMPSIDGKEKSPGVFGFQDTVAGIADPQIANYTPRASREELENAFKTRWIHGVNTQAPWSFVKAVISKNYADKFGPIPWFIGEYGANGQDKSIIEEDLKDIQLTAEKDSNFLGTAFFQFQTAHFKGGAELNFGLFALGDEKLFDVAAPCDEIGSADCKTWPVYCLTTDLKWLPGGLADRAGAVAAAWKGSLTGPGLCEGSEIAATSTAIVTTTTKVTTASPSQQTLATTSLPGPFSTGAPDSNGMPPLSPLRGIAYGALPCNSHSCGKTGWVSEDMLQEPYEKQWGADGRDDLGTMSRMGANAVRLYHSLGLDGKHDHGGFLDRAQAEGLNVMPGYHTNGACPNFDCFDTWKNVTLQGFDVGFKKNDEWHPAVATLILLNEPDFFGGYPQCKPAGAWCRVKAVLSALDGVLAAEKVAGVKPGRVRLSVTWSFGMMPSIDGKVSGPGVFGFQDTVAGIADPQIANYTPRATRGELEHAFKTRWIHGVNTQAPWSFVKDVISKDYEQLFAPIPWFIGEYGANGQSKATIQGDLEDIQHTAENDANFLGTAFFQFQTAYFKGGAELNFGIFGLGEKKLFDIKAPCDDTRDPNCKSWPVYCLTTDLAWLPGTMGERADAVATAWRGSLSGPGFCKSPPPRLLAHETAGETADKPVAGQEDTTILSCQIQGVDGDIASKQEEIREGDLNTRLVEGTISVLGEESIAIKGDMHLASLSLIEIEIEDIPSRNSDVSDSPRRSWTLPAVAFVLIIGAGIVLASVVARGKQARSGEVPHDASMHTDV